MKVNIWVVDDQDIYYDLVISSFPQNANEYTNFYKFNKGMDAVNTINKALLEKDYDILPDIAFIDYYIEGDGWTGDKIVKLIVELYKKYRKSDIKPHIIAFSSISRRNEDMLKVGAVESITKIEIGGVCNEIVNNFYDKDAVMHFLKPRQVI